MENIKDEFQGFGKGFVDFPRRLPEDCVEYTLYIINSKLQSQKELLTRLEAVRKEAVKLMNNLLKDYIWQRDSFSLELESGKGMMYLHGTSSYGDSVDDEWLIVYLLKELSRAFEDLWIKVIDTDGEFLLIEAANALPRWLNPEIADNRVWINKEKLRIIPLSAASNTSSTTRTASVSHSLTIEEGLRTITSNPEILMNSPLIEAEAFYRLRNYPAQISASLHHSLITIPRKLAFVLHSMPSTIAPAIEAFYLRDPVSLRPLQLASPELIFPPIDLVTVSVKFTKVLYAQLRSQRFSIPAAWKDIIAQPKEDDATDISLEPNHKWLETGMKVTSGFEMFITDPKNGDNRKVREIKIVLEDLAEDESLELPTDEEIAKWSDVRRADDEKWLDINFEDFDRELQGSKQDKEASINPRAFGPDRPSGFGDAKTESDLKKIVERFEAFLNDESAGVDGAELDDMDIDDDEDDLDEDTEEEDKDVSFDENEFARMMREMMGMPSEEDKYQTAAFEPATTKASKIGRIREVNADEEDKEEEAAELRKVMQRMEAELNEAGALNLDPTPKKLATLKSRLNSAESNSATKDVAEENSDEEVDIDLNLAKNLLESFKSQAGMAGPGGNLLGMMGMQLPRDEDDLRST
ncbi:SGT1 protein-domain-containing protein [Bisporella sp. PMI_857]|nr:SGT1 protein-domain-containing protein [Bisporella sp. PMI_857]